MTTTRALWPSRINLYLFQQNGGWIFILGNNIYDKPLRSGKRRTMKDAMDAAKSVAPENSMLVYFVLDNTINDWMVL